MLWHNIQNRLICGIYLAILLLLSPFCIILALFTWLLDNEQNHENQLPKSLRRKILITGDTATKAIHIIRILGKAGHEIVVADWLGPYSVLRWSKYVSKAYTVPSSHKEYVLEVTKIALNEKIDYFIPVIKKDYAIADAQIGEYLKGKNINSLVCTTSEIEMLDEKISFMQKCKSLNLSVPQFVESEDEIYQLSKEGVFKDRHFFMKPSACTSKYRNSFERIPNNTEDIQEFLKCFKGESFFAQEFIHGRELSANLISKNGEILQLNFSTSSAIQVDYNVIKHDKIFEWVTEFCGKTKLNAAVCFDFIEDMYGEIYCLECNPRFHSSLVTYLYSPGYERCLLSLVEDVLVNFQKPLQPNLQTFCYWFYQELFNVLTLKKTLKTFIEILRTGNEALWDSSDPIPYLIYHHAQIPVSLVKHIITGEYWECVNFCLGRVMY